MPYITNFVFKDNEKSRKVNNKKSTILQAILLDKFPNEYSFGIQFTIVFENPYIEHSGFVKFCRSDGSTIAQSAGFKVNPSIEGSSETDDFEMLTGVAYELEFENIRFERPGLYITKIYCNKEVIAKFGITVAENEV
ncbi:MAG: hypothetical protein ABS948_11950 [Solibacillus sp.]